MAMAQPQEQNQEPLRMTKAEYFAFEENSEIKHEYARGRVYAMSGGSLRHGMITVNISTDLNNQLEEKDCGVSSPDTRIKVEVMESYRYPDVTVFCGDPEFMDDRVDTIGNPVVLVEVLSPSTALKDCNEKLKEYTQSKTLQEYVLVSQHEAQVEVFSRYETGEWVYRVFTGLDKRFALPSIDCTLELSRIYRKITLDVEEENP